MSEGPRKVGIISCSGEDLCEGTISRLATQRVLGGLRPDQTVTICLPLFLAGDGQERIFAQKFPTITVDGCDKRCAQRGTETYSGPVSAALVVTDLLPKDSALSGERTYEQVGAKDKWAIDLVADRLVQEIDAVLAADVVAASSQGEAV